ncbi:MAG: hypothetical protein GTO18_02530 [Anaerolineales bacterium]|nr:hypothetical protein [Anaerolineales bacterium]
MERKRPFGVTVLAVLPGLAAIAAIIHTLQMLHLFPIRLGNTDFVFFTFDLLGAILWGILAAIWIWVVRSLWSVNPEAWLFVVILSMSNIIFDLVSLLGGMSWEDMAWSLVINSIIFIYAIVPGTRAAFSIGDISRSE